MNWAWRPRQDIFKLCTCPLDLLSQPSALSHNEMESRIGVEPLVSTLHAADSLMTYAVKPRPEAHMDLILFEVFLKNIHLIPQDQIVPYLPTVPF